MNSYKNQQNLNTKLFILGKIVQTQTLNRLLTNIINGSITGSKPGQKIVIESKEAISLHK